MQTMQSSFMCLYKSKEASGVYTIKSRSRAANHSKGTKVGAKGEHYRVTQEELRSFQYLPQTIKDFNQRTASNNKGEGYNATEEEPRKQAYSIYVLQTIKKPSEELQSQQKDKSKDDVPTTPLLGDLEFFSNASDFVVDVFASKGKYLKLWNLLLL
ncbi:hypothetical protein WN943_000736 [Citrus x changshan-huyou]